MTLRVPKALGSTELVTLSDAYLMSDPRKVLLCRREGVTNKEYLDFARAVYSSDNIRTCPLMFLSRDETRGISVYNSKFLAKVPADLHQWSFYLSIYPDYFVMDSYVDCRSMPLWHGEYLWYISLPQTNANIDSDSYWEGLISYLQSVRDFFEAPSFAIHLGKKVTTNTWMPNNVLYYAVQQMNGRQYIYRQTNANRYQGISQGMISAAACMDVLSAGTSDVTFSLRDGQWVLICPVSLQNKSSLYQVFNASTDVVGILGGIKLDKKTVVKGDKTLSYLTGKAQKGYGVEVELTTTMSVKQMIDNQGDEIFFLCKADASITGSKANKYECVTRPMSLPQQRVNWARFFHNVGDMVVFDQSTLTNNGMHVHIDKSLFTPEHLQNFCWFLTNPAHTEFLLQLSQRTMESFRKWAPVPDYSAYRTPHKAWQNCIRESGNLRGTCNLGARTKKTVEVRLFKGIVSCSEIIRNVEAVDAFFEFTGMITEQSNRLQLTLRNFYKWLKATPKTQYKFLRADLFKLEMDKLIRRAEIQDLVFGLNDPAKIVERVNNAKLRSEKLGSKERFEIDNFVLATVTKIIGRKVFGQSDDGYLTLLHKNAGRIAHLDQKTLKAYVRTSA
jgi:hypothetical protein